MYLLLNFLGGDFSNTLVGMGLLIKPKSEAFDVGEVNQCFKAEGKMEGLNFQAEMRRMWLSLSLQCVFSKCCIHH